MTMNLRSTNGSDHVDVSVVVPSHNEQENVAPLLDQFAELARRARFTLEVVWVDDGSTDQTLARVADAQAQHRFLRVISLPHRRGLTEALRAGFGMARGDILVFYPADRQFHPADIPRLVEKVRTGYDLVVGRKIGQYSKRIVSGFYNRLSRLLFPSIRVSDLNSVKAFRRELVDVFDYRHDWHRFWVAIVSEAGYRVGEVDVTLYARSAGRSKFGFWRIPGAVLDLLAVKFQYHTMRRPLWYFGMTGLLLLAAAFVVGVVAIYQRFVQGHGYRPFIYLVMTLGLSGVVFFAIGFLAESVAGIRQQIESLRSMPKLHPYRPGAAPRLSVRPAGSVATDRRATDQPDRRRERPGPDRRPRPPQTERGTTPGASRPPAGDRRQRSSAVPPPQPPDRPAPSHEPMTEHKPAPVASDAEPEQQPGDLFVPPKDWADSGWREGTDAPPALPTESAASPVSGDAVRGEPATSAGETAEVPPSPPPDQGNREVPRRGLYGRRRRP